MQTICQRENNTESTGCTRCAIFAYDQSYLQECMKFNPTKCKEQAGCADRLIQVFFLGRVEHLDGLLFAQRKELLQTDVFLFLLKYTYKE